MREFYQKQPSYLQLNNQIEQLLYERNEKIKRGEILPQQTSGVVTLPVVVHIIHNNGSENISDAQVLTGIQHLNEAFANTGFYNPADGVNTQIQFCMAQRDPNNNATNGITRNVSAYTVMGGANYYSDDLNVKNINRWNPNCYINIWLVRSIPGAVAGYAYLPSAHGSNVDGIVQEAAYFGSSNTNDVVVIHEMGHYLGLYHTFEGSCTNNDCSKDGDKVCDTPPDQSTAGVGCGTNVNSCTTDALSGFSTDQNDLKEDYMDYGNWNCMKVFTQGQADRMNFFIQNTRKSLLACKSCLVPCPAAVVADFSSPGATVTTGTTVTFTNSSTNASTYEWYINNALQGSGTNFSYTFTAIGTFNIKLIAKSASSLCDEVTKTITINVVCGVTTSFTKSASTAPCGTNINFTNISTGATNYEWYVNGVLQSSGAGFSYTSNTASKYEIKLVAIDNIANCRNEYKDTVEFTCSVIADFIPLTNTIKINNSITFTSTGSGATSYQWLINGAAAGTGPTLMHTFNTVGVFSVKLITGNGLCTSEKTGVVYVNDNCNNQLYLFHKTFTAGIGTNLNYIQPTSDGGSVSCGNVTTNILNSDAAILKLDALGNIEWLKRYTDQSGSHFWKVKQLSSGGYIAIGSKTSTGSNGTINTFIVKTNSSGDITWSREYLITNASSNSGSDIIESADGHYYFCGYANEPGTTNGRIDAIVGGIDGTGNLLWLNVYDTRSSEYAQSLAEENNQLIVCGTKSNQTNRGSFLLKLNKTGGGIVWSKIYTSTDIGFRDIQIVSGGYFINAIQRSIPGGPTTDHVFVKTDYNGNILFSKYIQPYGNIDPVNYFSAQLKPNGNIISFSSKLFSTAATYFFVQEINPQTGVLWAKRYNRPNVSMQHLSAGSNGGLFLAGNSIVSSNNKMNVMTLDPSGNSGACSSENTGLELFTALYTESLADFTITKPPVQVPANHVYTVVNAETNSLCELQTCLDKPPIDTCIACRSIDLQGKDTVCNLVNLFDYKVIRNDSCKLPIQWNIDASVAQIIVATDSTIQLQFLKEGKVSLYASITTSCKTLKDSIEISIVNSNTSVNLGPDIQLCKFSSLPLKAGSGFKTYEWNDGSADSSFTVDKPGQYFVAVTDYCGNVYRDTINIALSPDVPFDLGPDLSKCSNDTITITAPGSFNKYTWASNYNINTTNGSTVKIWPTKDTSYTVVAEVASGCIVLDTIRIKVDKAAPINLGNDTSFCIGASVLLQAPVGFTGYLWQDNSTGSSFTASQKGKYWLHAKSANGCISKDTLEILNVYSLPAVQIGDDLTICQNNNYIFNAGSNYKSYLWQDGSSSKVYTTNQLGKYWVQVTDNNNCINSDTANIIAFKPSPKDFISKTIEVCKYKPTPITAIGNWKSYNWSNGSSGSGISLSTGGIYWLEVTNADGCTARESFEVATKECIKGIFFPNAFTPGKRGENNAYKPLVYADIVSYRFVVYNRFGQRIFETTDISKGWDGTINGKRQDPNTFVWICNYQFVNEQPKSEKGSFLLIH